MKKKHKSTQPRPTPHVQEQCGVWLSAKGRSKLQEGSNTQRILPCTTKPRQSRVVLGELTIPQPRPRMGGKQSTLSMFFKSVPSPLSTQSNGKESSHAVIKTSSKLNPPGDLTKPRTESGSNVSSENLIVGESEGSFVFTENNISESGFRSSNCKENDINGFTGCTLDSSRTAVIDHSSNRYDDSEASVLGKCSYVFQKVDLYTINGLESRKRSHGFVERQERSILGEEDHAPSKRYRAESYGTQESVIERSDLRSDGKRDESETKDESLVDKMSMDDSINVSCFDSKYENVKSKTIANQPTISSNINDTLSSQSSLSKTTNGKKYHKNDLMSQHYVITDAEDSLQSISEKFPNKRRNIARKSDFVKDSSDATGDSKSDEMSQNFALHELEDSLLSNPSLEDSLSVDDSLTPAILRNSIYKELSLVSDLPMTNPELFNCSQMSDYYSDEINKSQTLDSLHDWSDSENDFTEITRKF